MEMEKIWELNKIIITCMGRCWPIFLILDSFPSLIPRTNVQQVFQDSLEWREFKPVSGQNRVHITPISWFEWTLSQIEFLQFKCSQSVLENTCHHNKSLLVDRLIKSHQWDKKMRKVDNITEKLTSVQYILKKKFHHFHINSSLKVVYPMYYTKHLAYVLAHKNE